MKRTLTLFTLIFAFHFSYAQDDLYSPRIKPQPAQVQPPVYKGGEFLQKASNSLVTGVVMTLIGGVLIAAGETEEYQNDITPKVGLGLITAGVGFNIAGFIRIGKAGRAFQSTQ